MNLMRWDPFRTTARFDPFREMDDVTTRLLRLYKPFFPAEEEALITADWVPLVDIEETDKEYLLKIELPEVPKDAVKVGIEDGVLTIQGERKQEKEEKTKTIHRIERSYGKFLRTFTVPREVDEKKILAEFKDGLLKVHIPKTEVAKPKLVEVKVA
jgi:HSP20 family protein